MEAASDYWRAPCYLLEDRVETWLVNAGIGALPDLQVDARPLEDLPYRE
jgi:hypothetical protein